MPKLKMLTGLCGPTISLVRGDEHECDEREASGLIRAGFAVALDGFEPLPPEDPEADEDSAAEAQAKAEAAAAAKAEQDAADAKAAEEAAAAKADAEAKAKDEPATKPALAKAKV